MGRIDGIAEPLHIRPYRSGDSDEVTAIWLDSWKATGISSASITIEELRERWPLEIAGGWEVHVAVRGRALAGFLAFQNSVLEQLFVAPDQQGRGIGTRLLSLAKQRMPFGFRLTTALESRAVTFYEGEGLRRGAREPHPRLGHTTVHYDWRPARAELLAAGG